VAFAYAAFFPDAAASLTVMDFPVAGPATDEQQLRGFLWWFGFHEVPALPEQLVAGRQRTYLGWFHANEVLPPNRIAPAAVTEYVRAYCRPGALHGGFDLCRTIPQDTADNSSLTAHPLTLPILAMAAARPGDPSAQEEQPGGCSARWPGTDHGGAGARLRSLPAGGEPGLRDRSAPPPDQRRLKPGAPGLPPCLLPRRQGAGTTRGASNIRVE